MNEIITRKEARALGLPHYYTGKPCKRGHIAKRYVAGHCSECVTIRRNENRAAHKLAVKKWRASHRDKYNATQRRRYNQIAELEKKRRRTYNKEHQEERNMYGAYRRQLIADGILVLNSRRRWVIKPGLEAQAKARWEEYHDNKPSKRQQKDYQP